MPSKDFLGSYSRRGFLRQAARAGFGSLAASAVLRDLQLISTASASGPLDEIDDYKALCCIFLAGGNDSDNTIIASSTDSHPIYGANGPFGNYESIRQLLRIKKDDLEPVTLTNDGGLEFRLHPSFGTGGSSGTGINKLFEDKKAAVLFNVGPLMRPVTKAEYLAGTADLPPQLYSHSDQATHWQTARPKHPPKSGWGGRIADWMLEGVEDTGLLSSLNISVAGTNTFQAGENFHQYNVATKGAVTLGTLQPSPEWTGGWHHALQKIVAIPTPENLQRDAYAGVLGNAIAAGVDVNAALAGTGFNPTFPATSMGAQLKMVARLIAAREALGMPKRQTFFVQLGGFDTHAEQVDIVDPNNPTTSLTGPHTGEHARLLAELSDAIYAFQQALEQLGTMTGHSGIENKVISFTASDFGRTFRSNGLGSDHGWGGHHFIFGGNGEVGSALDGGKSYGTFPNQLISDPNCPDDAGGGRWIPTTSVDQYSATLAKWFGVSDTALDIIFPNLTNFGSGNRDLGFLNTSA